MRRSSSSTWSESVTLGGRVASITAINSWVKAIIVDLEAGGIGIGVDFKEEQACVSFAADHRHFTREYLLLQRGVRMLDLTDKPFNQGAADADHVHRVRH